MNCLHCNSPIILGRADRKFCCIDCKNEYHNAYKIREHAEIKKINLILKRNRRILKTLCAGEIDSSVSKFEMLERGFNFNFHTHTVEGKGKGQIIMCFDYGYTSRDNETFRIIKSPVSPLDSAG